MVMILPAFLYDLLKFSHRVAGPLLRCRHLMNEMAAGKTVPEFKPRKYDLMKNFFDAFNALIKKWNAQVNARANEEASRPAANAPAEKEVTVPAEAPALPALSPSSRV